MVQNQVQPPPAQLLLTVEDAAHALSIGRTLLYALIANGLITSVKIGRVRRVPLASLERFIEQLEKQGNG